jgi:ribose 5-phosphate isomerase RpiB
VLGHDVQVLGPGGPGPRDYPDAALAVGRAVSDGRAERGILLCGSGIGMAIAANKVRGVRAAFVHDQATDFEGGRHQRRVEKIEAMEEQEARRQGGTKARSG